LATKKNKKMEQKNFGFNESNDSKVKSWKNENVIDDWEFDYNQTITDEEKRESKETRALGIAFILFLGIPIGLLVIENEDVRTSIITGFGLISLMGVTGGIFYLIYRIVLFFLKD
jgi:hypothetical protein